ncbi:hypothetical protein [Neolewinella agarilytica]|uniref:HEAT repeat domain-containing protein n=1 Tax=Neolewinella agarilytica TaxID=478744 RepID=A0A1H9HAD1_9BACT|nr:hypothetical protein [Neolewinella agarilytica]SEQ59198.1 hypothetical protein SAMN05444359_11277 [Neolewinella agarilytica]
MPRPVILFLLLNCLAAPVTAQSTWLTEVEQEALPDSLRHLSRKLKAGDSTALVPLSALLDDQRLTTQRHYFGRDTVTVAQLAGQTFFQSTYLENLSWGAPISGATLWKYWRDNSHKIVFSPLLGRFTDVPPGTREVRYELQPAAALTDKARLLSDYKTKISRVVAHKDFFMPVKLIPEIGKLGTPEAFVYLKECAAGQHWGKGESPRDKQVIESIIKGLAHYQRIEAAQLVLTLTRRLEGWGHNGFVSSMNWITGIDLRADWRADQDSLVAEYQRLLDSLPALAQLRELGFRRADAARPEDFADRGAYLEYLITRPGQKAWVLFQALRELEAMRDPRILVQLAALPLHENIFSSRNLSGESRSRLEGLTGVRLLVKDSEGELVADGYDRVKSRNALHYWVAHYDEYQWSDVAARFVYQGDDIKPLDTLAVLVEQLYTKDDAAAVGAVAELMQLPVDSLLRRIDGRYFGGLHGANGALPLSLKTKLPALAEVLAICRERGQSTRLSLRTEATLKRLCAAVNGAEREKILSMLEEPRIDNITALEAWGYVHARQYPDAVEALDEWVKVWYADQWTSGSLSGENFRLFILKSALRRTGRFRGLWEDFEALIRGAGPEALTALEVLRVADTDERIRAEAAGILARTQVQSQDRFTVKEYLDFGALGAPVPVERVSVGLTPTALAAMFGRFEGSSQEARYRLIQLIDHHRDTTMTPHLLALAGDTTTIMKSFVSTRTDKGRFTEYFSIRQGDYMIWILEKLHGVRFRNEEQALPEEVPVRTSSSQAELRDKWRLAKRWRGWLGER